MSKAICIITNCGRSTGAGEAFCFHHREKPFSEPTEDDPNMERVREFHVAFGCHVSPEPRMPALRRNHRSILGLYAFQLDKMARQLKAAAAEANGLGQEDFGLLLVRLQLHVEETGELAEAFRDLDLAKALDALTDIGYVTDGTHLTLGLDDLKGPAQREVHRANMSKLDADGRPILHESGRVVKSELYSPPDLAALFE